MKGRDLQSVVDGTGCGKARGGKAVTMIAHQTFERGLIQFGPFAYHELTSFSPCHSPVLPSVDIGFRVLPPAQTSELCLGQWRDHWEVRSAAPLCSLRSFANIPLQIPQFSLGSRSRIVRRA